MAGRVRIGTSGWVYPHWRGARIRSWSAGGRDVLAYFNNDEHAYAHRDALRLRELVG